MKKLYGGVAGIMASFLCVWLVSAPKKIAKEYATLLVHQHINMHAKNKKAVSFSSRFKAHVRSSILNDFYRMESQLKKRGEGTTIEVLQYKIDTIHSINSINELMALRMQLKKIGERISKAGHVTR